MPYKAKGKCVYRKDTGKKVGCTKGSVGRYLAALHANTDESEEIKEIRKQIKNILFESINEAVGRIKKTKLNGVLYHGTSIYEQDDVFDEFNHRVYSDYEAIWFSNEEKVAEDFADRNQQNDNDILAIYKVQINCNAIADINFAQSQEMMDNWGLDDFRDSIKILKNKGYFGWITPGAIDGKQYDDIALFNLTCIKILGVKLLLNEKWTHYLTLEKAQELIYSVRNNDLLEDIKIPIEVGDTVLGGKFKNKKIIVKKIDKNEKGDITINGKPLLRFRIIKENLENKYPLVKYESMGKTYNKFNLYMSPESDKEFGDGILSLTQPNKDGFVQLIGIRVDTELRNKGLGEFLIIEALKNLKKRNIKGIFSSGDSRSESASKMWERLKHRSDVKITEDLNKITGRKSYKIELV